MKKIAVVCFLWFVSAAAFQAAAQVVPAATRSSIHVDAGGFGSAFQPDYQGGGVASSSANWLFGAGAFVDVRFSRWVNVEAEGRWLRFNQFVNIHQDNYLIGPKVPIHTFGKYTPYGKFLFGIGSMNFEYGSTSCRCAALVYGGGVDYKLNDKWTVRAADFEYQQWPNWYVNQNAQLHPYGFSSGISYRIF